MNAAPDCLFLDLKTTGIVTMERDILLGNAEHIHRDGGHTNTEMSGNGSRDIQVASFDVWTSVRDRRENESSFML